MGPRSSNRGFVDVWRAESLRDRNRCVLSGSARLGPAAAWFAEFVGFVSRGMGWFQVLCLVGIETSGCVVPEDT